jgi:predicted kinase
MVKRAPKGAVVLSVGLPGSGKTTWFKRKGVTPLSSDLLRTLLFDDPTEQGHQDLVFSSLRYLLRARLMARMPMNYVDATNLSPKERRHWIRMAREFGYEVHAVFFEVPLQTCLERNRKRQRVVPEEVMQRMSAKLRPPTFEEGFSKIIVVRVKQRPEAEEAPAEQPAIEPAAKEPAGGEPASGPEVSEDSGDSQPEG